MNSMIDTRKEALEQDINFQLLKNYGDRLGVAHIEEVGKDQYQVKFEYNKLFNIVDEESKTVFIRNIHFDEIYSAEVSVGEKLKLPIRELNKSINDEFMELREHLFERVVQNREIVLKILQNVHTTSYFLNKFKTILQELFYQESIDKNQLAFYRDSENKYSKYLELIIDSNLAKEAYGELRPTAQFKKIFEEAEGVNEGLERALTYIVQRNYDYIVYELSIRQLKAYLSIISSYLFLSKDQRIERHIDIRQLYKVHTSLFGRAKYSLFIDRVYALATSGVFSLNNNRVAISA